MKVSGSLVECGADKPFFKIIEDIAKKLEKLPSDPCVKRFVKFVVEKVLAFLIHLTKEIYVVSRPFKKIRSEKPKE